MLDDYSAGFVVVVDAAVEVLVVVAVIGVVAIDVVDVVADVAVDFAHAEMPVEHVVAGDELHCFVVVVVN